MVKILLLVLTAEILTAVGQVLFKKSTNAVGSYSLRRVDTHFRFLIDVLTKPSIWTGFLFMVLALPIWIMALAQGDLSLVFSLGSSQYLLILFLAHMFLGEKIDKAKLIGTFLVIFGIILITMT